MSENRIKILYLDDEINNLNTFRASFRRNYEIYTALTVTEARTLLEEVQVEVIIADQRMPTTTGVEFFNAIKEKFPDPIRILLTGYTDIEDLIDSINKGQIYRFIRKPWEEFEIQERDRQCTRFIYSPAAASRKGGSTGKGQRGVEPLHLQRQS